MPGEIKKRNSSIFRGLVTNVASLIVFRNITMPYNRRCWEPIQVVQILQIKKKEWCKLNAL